MIITPSQERSIKENFFELSFEDREPDFGLFQKLSSTEQFYLASIYNWDDGPQLLHWIIDSKKCDKGTASLIFWSAEPDWYLSKSRESLTGDEELEVYDLLQKIIRKFQQKEFKRGMLKFDPSEEIEYYDEDISALPDALTKPTFGVRPFCLSNISHFLKQLKKQLSPKQRKRNKKRKSRHN